MKPSPAAIAVLRSLYEMDSVKMHSTDFVREMAPASYAESWTQLQNAVEYGYLMLIRSGTFMFTVDFEDAFPDSEPIPTENNTSPQQLQLNLPKFPFTGITAHPATDETLTYTTHHVQAINPEHARSLIEGIMEPFSEWHLLLVFRGFHESLLPSISYIPDGPPDDAPRKSAQSVADDIAQTDEEPGTIVMVEQDDDGEVISVNCSDPAIDYFWQIHSWQRCLEYESIEDMAESDPEAYNEFHNFLEFCESTGHQGLVPTDTMRTALENPTVRLSSLFGPFLAVVHDDDDEDDDEIEDSGSFRKETATA